MYYYSALQPKDCTHLTQYSIDFGAIKIEHTIASGGAPPRPPASEIYVYSIFKTLHCLKLQYRCVMLHSSTPECQIMCTNSTLIGA